MILKNFIRTDKFQELFKKKVFCCCCLIMIYWKTMVIQFDLFYLGYQYLFCWLNCHTINWAQGCCRQISDLSYHFPLQLFILLTWKWKLKATFVLEYKHGRADGSQHSTSWENIYQFSLLIREKENKNFSAEEFPRITGLQTKKHKEVILELILNIELEKDLPAGICRSSRHIYITLFQLETVI